MAAFKGSHWPLAVQIAKQEFWPLMRAGWTLWPVISVLNYTVVKSVQIRSLIGNLAGMGWNIYLSLFAEGI
jgi:hypothetical protein